MSSRLFSRETFSHRRFWVGAFLVWLISLSGGLLRFQIGMPGLLQWSQLKGELSDRRTDLASIDAEILVIDQESRRLERSRAAQEKEIRRVLGYVAEDELIFDFSSASREAVIE